MTTTITLTDILDAIVGGACDDNLDAVTNAVRDRKGIVSSRTFAATKIGATGRLKNLRPKYLIGAPVTVVGRKTSRLQVTIDPEWLERNCADPYKYRGQVGVTPDMIDLD